jgi:hypothetical protein
MGREAELQTKGRRFAPLDHESEDAA